MKAASGTVQPWQGPCGGSEWVVGMGLIKAKKVRQLVVYCASLL